MTRDKVSLFSSAGNQTGYFELEKEYDNRIMYSGCLYKLKTSETWWWTHLKPPIFEYVECQCQYNLSFKPSSNLKGQCIVYTTDVAEILHTSCGLETSHYCTRSRSNDWCSVALCLSILAHVACIILREKVFQVASTRAVSQSIYPWISEETAALNSVAFDRPHPSHVVVSRRNTCGWR